MPACFQLTRKGETSPSTFAEIDKQMCFELGTIEHEQYYLCEWYDVIGFGLACGHDFDTLIKRFGEQENHGTFDRVGRDVTIVQCAQWLKEHYSSYAYRG